MNVGVDSRNTGPGLAVHVDPLAGLGLLGGLGLRGRVGVGLVDRQGGLRLELRGGGLVRGGGLSGVLVGLGLHLRLVGVVRRVQRDDVLDLGVVEHDLGVLDLVFDLDLGVLDLGVLDLDVGVFALGGPVRGLGGLAGIGCVDVDPDRLVGGCVRGVQQVQRVGRLRVPRERLEVRRVPVEGDEGLTDRLVQRRQVDRPEVRARRRGRRGLRQVILGQVLEQFRALSGPVRSGRLGGGRLGGGRLVGHRLLLGPHLVLDLGADLVLAGRLVLDLDLVLDLGLAGRLVLDLDVGLLGCLVLDLDVGLLGRLVLDLGLGLDLG